jgi:hypothetical protein
MKVAGEVKADAPRKDPVEPEPAVSTPDLPNDLPKLRDFIRARKAPLAGFMEQGASLSLEADVLTVIPRKDIYVRYLNDNKSTIAALASELYDRKISVNFKSQQQGVTNSGPSFPERRDRSEAFSAPDLPNNSRVVSAAGGPSATFDGGSKSGLEQLVDSARTAQENSQASSAAEREQTRKALYTDPVVRLIFDELQGRLVEVREKSSSANNEKVDPKATDRS